MASYYQLFAALALIIGGSLKAIVQNAPSDPFAIYWCTSSDVATTGGHGLALWHCSGCYVALAGFALLTHWAMRELPAICCVQARMR